MQCTFLWHLRFALTLQRLPTTLFRFRFEGVKDGGADKQIGKCTHDQGYRAHILFLHSSFRRVMGELILCSVASPPLAVQFAGLFLAAAAAHLAKRAAPAVVHMNPARPFRLPRLTLKGQTTQIGLRPKPTRRLHSSFVVSAAFLFSANSLSTLIALKIISLGANGSGASAGAGAGFTFFFFF